MKSLLLGAISINCPWKSLLLGAISFSAKIVFPHSDFLKWSKPISQPNRLYWSANSTHKNPECFPEPEKFEPSRFEGNGPAPYTYVPFGGGPRMCPGKEYARLEILVFMHNVVKRFKWEKVLPEEKVIVNPMPIPEHGLPVRLSPHPQPVVA